MEQESIEKAPDTEVMPPQFEVDGEKLLARVRAFARELADEWRVDSCMDGSHEKPFWFALSTLVTGGIRELIAAAIADGSNPQQTYQSLRASLSAGEEAGTAEYGNFAMIRFMALLSGETLDEFLTRKVAKNDEDFEEDEELDSNADSAPDSASA